jgi:hypothetical protein
MSPNNPAAYGGVDGEKGAEAPALAISPDTPIRPRLVLALRRRIE